MCLLALCPGIAQVVDRFILTSPSAANKNAEPLVNGRLLIPGKYFYTGIDDKAERTQNSH